MRKGLTEVPVYDYDDKPLGYTVPASIADAYVASGEAHSKKGRAIRLIRITYKSNTPIVRGVSCLTGRRGFADRWLDAKNSGRNPELVAVIESPDNRGWDVNHMGKKEDTKNAPTWC